MSPVMASLYHAVEMVERVTARLEHDGAALELDQLAGLSVDELDLLVRLERGACGSPQTARVGVAA